MAFDVSLAKQAYGVLEQHRREEMNQNTIHAIYIDTVSRALLFIGYMYRVGRYGEVFESLDSRNTAAFQVDRALVGNFDNAITNLVVRRWV